jgi:HSP20 family protein
VPITGREIGGGRHAEPVPYQVRSITMTIVRWDSSRDLAAMQQQENLSRLQQETLARMFEGYYRRPQEDLNRGAWVPVVDIYSNGHDLVLKAELPDMKEEEIELTIEGNTLTLSGEKKLDTDVTEELFHRIERSYGAFARTFTLPPTVDANKVSAQYKAGVLTVRLPVREDAKPNRIKIAVAA